jgi:phosphate transport system permease protein
MTVSTTLLVLLAMSTAAFFLGRRRSLALADAAGGLRSLHSLPAHYGTWTAILCGLPALVVLLGWKAAEPAVIEQMIVADLPAEIATLDEGRIGLFLNDVRNTVAGNVAPGAQSEAVIETARSYEGLQERSSQLRALLAIGLAVAGLALGRWFVAPAFRARNRVEGVALGFLVACSTFAIFTTVGIVFSVIFESIRFFQRVPLTEFLFGLNWSPQTALRIDQVGASGAFGAVPLFAGTMLISLIAMLVAGPVGLMTAIYLAEYAPRRVRAIVKPLLEVLAGIPTVVYGFFAALVVAPKIREMGMSLGLDVASESALAAGLVMGIMIIPFVSSLSDDVINAVPQTMRDGALALGATQSETVKQVIIPAALPGIVGGLLLAVSRAIGETMIVVMAAGLAANLTVNPLEAVTTVTVQIVTLLVGDQEFDSAKTLAAFALGLLLFVVTLILNVIALHVVRKYREQYE